MSLKFEIGQSSLTGPRDRNEDYVGIVTPENAFIAQAPVMDCWRGLCRAIGFGAMLALARQSLTPPLSVGKICDDGTLRQA